MKRLLLGAILLVWGVTPCRAQEPDSSRIDRRGLYTAAAVAGGYYAGGMVVMEKVWYHDRRRVPFHFFNDNGGYLQVDKFGHAFGAYVESYVGYAWMKKMGVEHALIYGGALGLVLQTPIEIMDGLHEGWGFSWGDMAANALGSGLVIGQELLFGEQVATYKFSYSESRYASLANGYLGTSFLDRMLTDYNGHTYWLSVPVRRVLPGLKVPPWLSVAVGYGANGMFGEFENVDEYEGVAIPTTSRYRQVLFSLDIDWSRIETRSKILNAILDGMVLIKLPFPAFEFNSKGKSEGYWVYY